MKLRLWFFPMIFVSFFLISATTVNVESTPATLSEVITELPSAATTVKKNKLNFVERLLLKYVQHKYKKAEGEDTTKADKQASTSLSFGIAAISLLVLGLFIPFVIIGTIPTGIVAMTTGSSALRNGTKEENKARTGKSLGLASIISFGALLIIGLILLAALFNNWG